MKDSEIIELYFARSENAITETDKKHGAFCRSMTLSSQMDADDSDVWVYDEALSRAVWMTVRLRMLQELCPQIKKIDLVVGSEPDAYKIVIHANKADHEQLKSNEAFEMFYDPELMGFAE